MAVILKHHPNLTPPIPIENLAREVGIVEIVGKETDSFEGALLVHPDRPQGAILYNLSAARPRRRFTIGHELGHFLIPWHRASGNTQCTKLDMRIQSGNAPHQRKEAEANRFSAGMLMPKSLFERDLRRLGDVDVAHVLELRERYGTSLEASANRYIDLTDDRDAFVFSHNGTIRYIKPTRDFPKLAVRRNDELPAGSMSARATDPIGKASEWQEVRATAWLAESSLSTVLEQTIVQKGGYRTTLLYIDPTSAEQDEEEEKLQASWSIRFRRQ